MDKFNSMYAFCRIVELGTFTAVAKEMGLSAMMISKHIAQLEKTLGVSLLNRTTRKVSLTEAGEKYYHRSKQILEDLLELEEQTLELSNTVKGILKISAPIDFGGIHLVPAINTYQQLNLNVSVLLSLENGPVNLTDGSFDLAIRVTDTLDPGFIARKFTETKLSLYASPDYLAANGHPQTIKDLLQHRCLHYLDTPHGEFWILDVNGKPEKIKPQWHFASNNGRVLGQAAALGMGIVQAPELSVARFLEDRRLIEILPEYSLKKIPIYAIYPQRRFIPAKITTFVNFIVEYYRSDVDG
jgi:DNA-binding transcriptional LysR family regulator